MFSMRFEWKESNVNLQALEAHMRAEYPNYVGNQASSALELYFSEELSQEDQDDIQAYWDLLDNTGYVTQEQISAAIASMKAGMINKTYDQLSVGEKKLLLGLNPTNAELGL